MDVWMEDGMRFDGVECSKGFPWLMGRGGCEGGGGGGGDGVCRRRDAW